MLEHLGDGTFARDVEPKWWGDRSPHGGYLASLMLKAMRETIADATRPPRSLSVHFLAPPRDGSVTIATRIERSGRVLTSASATLRQGDAALALALASFSSSWPGLDYRERLMPETPPPDALAPAPIVDGLAPEFFKNFDARPAIGERPFSSAGTAMSGGWIRTAEPRVLDEVLITVFADAWFPTIFARLSAPVPVPTVDLTLHFRTPLPLEGAAPDAFCLAVFSSEMAYEGFFVEDGEMWSENGQLLAQSRQLGVMIRPPKEDPPRA